MSSYPESSPSEELAKELAAVKLLAVIESSEAGGLPTSGGAAALAGLAALLADRAAGVWATQVPHLYRCRRLASPHATSHYLTSSHIT